MGPCNSFITVVLFPGFLPSPTCSMFHLHHDRVSFLVGKWGSFHSVEYRLSQEIMREMSPNSFLCFFPSFWLCHSSSGILVPQPRIKPTPVALEAWSLNHWTTREVPPLKTSEDHNSRSPPTDSAYSNLGPPGTHGRLEHIYSLRKQNQRQRPMSFPLYLT